MRVDIGDANIIEHHDLKASILHQINSTLNSCEYKISSLDEMVNGLMENQAIDRFDKQVVMSIEGSLDEMFQKVVSFFKILIIHILEHFQQKMRR